MIKLNSLMLPLLLALAALCAAPTCPAAEQQRGVLTGMPPGVNTGANTGVHPTAPVVVELFTAQGCRACPPADALLQKLAARGDVLALGFHVAYWDYIGWADPFAEPAFMQRQKAYAEAMDTTMMYTPQVIVNGTAEIVGTDVAAVETLVACAKTTTATTTAVWFESATNGQITAVLTPVASAIDAQRPDKPMSDSPIRGAMIRPETPLSGVWLVRFDRLEITEIAAGDNAGRTARNANIVRGLTRLSGWDGTPQRIPLVDIDLHAPGAGIAVLVQNHDGRIIGAAAFPPNPSLPELAEAPAAPVRCP